MERRYLYVHPYNNYTGSTKVMADVLKSKYQDLSKITVITNISQDGFLSELGLKLINVPIVRYNGRAIPLFSHVIWFIVGFFKVLFYARKYDIIYINTILPGFAAIAARLLRKNVIYHIHEKFVLSSFKSRVCEFILSHIKAHHIFVSKYLQDQYPEIYSCTDEICYNKLSEDYLDKIEIVPLKGHTRNRVIMLSSLNKMKGLNTFVEVAKYMPDFHFTLIISSSMKEINYFFGSDLPSNLELLSRQSNVHPFMKRSDFVLNLSNPLFGVETFGLTIIEGMAYGLPAIVPNIGGPIEIIKNGINGFSIDVTNVQEIVKTLRYSSSLDVYSKLYNNALAEVEKFK